MIKKEEEGDSSSNYIVEAVMDRCRLFAPKSKMEFSLLIKEEKLRRGSLDVYPALSLACGLIVGEFIKVNYVNAVKLLTLAAEKDDADAMLILSYLLESKEEVSDLLESLKWGSEAARVGNPVAQFNLGTMFDEGISITQDQKHGAFWCLRSARHSFGCLFCTNPFLVKKGTWCNQLIGAKKLQHKAFMMLE